MKILSLDISTKSTGYAVYNSKGLKEFGTFVPDKNKDYILRGAEIAENVRLLVLKHGHFDHVVIENIKVSSNLDTVVSLAIVQGMIIWQVQDFPITFVSPSMWRSLFHLNTEGRKRLKRKQQKEKAIKLCQSKGLDVKNDDEAEAILIGKYFTEKCLDKSKFSDIIKNIKSNG